jgi:hypothetical protein
MSVINFFLANPFQLGPLPLESDNVEGRLSRGIIVTITFVAALLLILNIVLISCYVKKRNSSRKLMNGRKFLFYFCLMCFVLFARQGYFLSAPTKRNVESEMSLVVILSVTTATTLSLLIVVILLTCVWRHRVGSKTCLGLRQGGGICCTCLRMDIEENAQPGSTSTSEGKLHLNHLDVEARSSFDLILHA